MATRSSSQSSARRRSWREKLADDKDLPKVITLEGAQAKRWGAGTMVIPAPREVDALMRKVRLGQLATLDDLRAKLAKAHQATLACPLTTGIFAWIAAHAAAEDETEGQSRVTPWWRVLKTGGKLNPKFPGGIAEQARRLRAEGHVILEDRVRGF